MSFENRFRLIHTWCERGRIYSAGWPNFHSAQYASPTRIVYGHLLLKDAVVDWRDVPAREFNVTDIRSRLTEAYEYALRNGYGHGFPNFHAADYGSGTVYGTLLVNRGACEWRDVPARELGLGEGDPTALGLDNWFRGAYNYGISKGFSGAMPNGHYKPTAKGYVCGVLLFPKSSVEWKDIRGQELGLPDVGSVAVAVTLHSFTEEKGTRPITGPRLEFARRVISTLAAIVNDPRFKKDVLNLRNRRAKYMLNRTEHKDATNQEIEAIISGGKEWNRAADNEIDLILQLENRGSGSIGATTHFSYTSRTNHIYFNRWFKNNQVLSLARHWMHEWLHVAGFRHVYINDDPDFTDAIYQIGRLVENWGKQVLLAEGESLESVENSAKGYNDLLSEFNGRIYEGDRGADPTYDE